MQPTKQLFTLARVMFEDAWNDRLQSVTASQGEIKRQLKAVEKQIESLLDRIVEATSPSVISAYETHLTKLEREKFVLAEKESSALPPKGRLKEFIELSLKFLASPWNIYKNNEYATRQTVLRLAFVKPLQYNRNKGYRTPEISFPFKMLDGISGRKSEMVRAAGLEPASRRRRILSPLCLPVSPRPRRFRPYRAKPDRIESDFAAAAVR